MKYADVIVDITAEQLDRTFQYRIPEMLAGTIRTGMQVEIPFGNGGKIRKGYVIGLTDQPAVAENRMKEIRGIAAGGVGAESRLIALAGWIRENYGSTMIQALKTVLPVKEKIRAREEKTLTLLLSEEKAKEQLDFYRKKHQTARERLLGELMAEKRLDYKEAVQRLNLSASVVRTMEEQGVLQVRIRQISRTPLPEIETVQEPLLLTGEQQRVAGEILEEWKGKGRTCLIRGVTGSGKTQVYLKLLEEVLKKGKQAIVLIPEIALTYQTVMRFCRRFGSQVSVIHSRMSQGERYDQFELAKKGQVKIMIGPRSALFTPFPNLGLILIDEEHEGSYKSENTPRYHARETAIARAALEGARVVLGSATPSVDAFYQCELGNYRLLTLTERYENRPLPRVEIADMRQELREGNRSIFSRRLQEAMEDRLEKGEQIMLFLNRRGYAGFVSCRSCGHVVKCPHCDVSLSEHRGGVLVCHYCGYQRPGLLRCPSCGSPYIGGFRAGTQQIEQLVKKRFPGAGVLRMDLDTTRKKGGHEKILEAFAEKKASILIGTQMIVKGHDFPGVTLVGVLAADLSLHGGDYRAAERTFQLLTQAVGRAGRGTKPGEAVIQTYSPDHYAVQTAAEQDYEAFYRQEMNYRKLLGYPPASSLMAVHGSGTDEAQLALAMEYLQKFLVKLDRNRQLQIIGPAPESIARISDRYRSVLYVKQKDYSLLVWMKDRLEQYIEVNKGFQKITIQFEFNG